MGMNNERDPITEWEHAIERRVGGAVIVCMIAVFVGAMVAPIFGWWIKGLLYKHYALETDCDQKVEDTMKFVWVCLWILAFMAWAIAIGCNLCGYARV